MSMSLRSVFVVSLLRQQPWFRPVVRVLAGWVAVCLVAWLVVPPLAKGPLERLASERLGREVTVGGVDFRPWSLEFTLREVTVAGVRGASAQLTIGRIHADGELQSLLRWAPVVDALTIDTPVLRITHLGDGRYDVDDIIARLTAPASPAVPDTEPDKGPARLALYNLALAGGSIDFIDTTVSETHEVRALSLKVPFISTLPSQREVKVEPHLAFTLDGSRFDSSAQGTPFAQTGQADAQIRLEGLNLAPYLAYLPAGLPFKVQAATLDAHVKVAFEQHPRLAVALSGTVQASGVRIADRQGAELLSYERLKIDMADVRPLEQMARLSHVELTSPVLTVTRDALGRINLAQRAAPASAADLSPSALGGARTSAAPAASSAASPATGASSAAARAPQAAAATPAWAVEVATAAVRGGTLRWSDQTTRPAASLQATAVTLEAADLAWPLAPANARPLSFQGGLNLQAGTLRFTGEATRQSAQLRTTLNALSLQLAAPYLAGVLEPTLAGQLSGDLGVRWQAPAEPSAQNGSTGSTGITVHAGPLAVEQLTVRQGKATWASVGTLEIAGAELPLDTRIATLQRLSLRQPQLTLERGADGRWMFERWLKAAPQAQGGAADAPEVPAPSEPSRWTLRVADFSLQGGSVAFADKAQPRPVALSVTGLGIAARNLASDGSKPEPLRLTARVAAAGHGDGLPHGQMDFEGSLAVQPLAVQGQLAATRLPLHALDGYLASQLAVQLLRADVGYRGQVALEPVRQGMRLRLAGDGVVEALTAHSTAAFTPKTEAQVGEELLSWKSLNLQGLAIDTGAGTAPRVEVKETSLVDFFARVTVNEAGRINLSDITKTPAEVQAANAASAQANARAAPGAPAATTAAAPVPAPTAAAGQTDPLAPVVVIGPVSLVNGKVLFSDYFVKPNYTANLSELTGKLGAFSTLPTGGAPALAELELRGRAEGSAALEVTGKLNPLARPLALDIKGKVQGLELPPLSPYAVKYAGHGIERGKLSMDVRYQVLPGGRLTASNRVVLQQLAFGDPVPDAPGSLPVKLATALLADRQGVIDLDLPLSGSLNDPEFRLGPVIGRLLLSLVGKALTSPFSLLASALGGSDAAQGQVPFAPGSAALTDAARQNLDKVAQALAERPSLLLTVTGTASLAHERDGLLRARLAQQLLAEKRRATPGDASAVQPHEYPALLREAYRRADMPKPRNLVGVARELSEPEMEALLLAQHTATEAQAAELAAQRAQAVRAYLVQQRRLPAERLFVAAPSSGPGPQPWTPRAELSLATR
ncbi:DUF748 domain-containing protein [Paracidovorax sp. MALMAid1276]|uniref:DUF748 domain-containing protein n=1 Tax=Paracidovorax sp. MALMAid1276 TaxID=3411631 RepID=UPI003B9AFF7E